MRKWKTIALATLVSVALIASACSSDDNSSSDKNDTTPAAAGCTAGATPLKIGALAQAQNFAGMADGIKAAVAEINKNCVGGRTIEFVGLEDDGSDPQKNLELARKLVEQSKVFAIIATSAVLLPATTDYLAEQGVPFFGWGFMPGFCGKDSLGFGFNGCLSGFALGLTDLVNGALIDPLHKATGKTADTMTVVVLNSDDDAGRFGEKQYKALIPSKMLLESAFVPTGASDVTQYVNLVKQKNPDVVMVSTDFATGIKMKAAISQSGYKGIVYDYTTYIPGLLGASPDTAKALEGGYSNTQFPANEDNTAAVQQITAALKASGSQLPFATQGASIGYWSTELLGQMLTAVGAKGAITSSNFKSVIGKGFKSKAVAGGLGSVSFPEGHSTPVPCSGLVKVTNGAFVSAVPFACYALRKAAN